MTFRSLARSTVGGSLAAAIAAAFLASAPISSASAGTYGPRDAANAGYGDTGYRSLEADSDCGTFLAQPPYVNGFTAQACQGVVRGGASTIASRHME